MAKERAGPTVFVSGAPGDRLGRHLRLFEIDRLVRAGKHPNASSLAAHCGVTRKTIQRDLDTLRWELGAPIAYDAGHRGYYYTEPGYGLPAVTVTEQELFALLVAQRAIDNYAGTPLEAPLRAAFDKLRRVLSPEVCGPLEVVPESIHFAGLPGPTIEPAVWQTLHRAIRERRTVEMRVYVAARNRETRRRFDPYAIVVRERDWFVVGYDHQGGKFPYFYIPRIREISLTEESFEHHADFDMSRSLVQGFAGMQGDGQPRTVEIRFSPEVATAALERPWSARQTHRRDRQGGVIISFQTDALFQVVRQVLPWGPDAEVLRPKELRDCLAATAASLAALYRPPRRVNRAGPPHSG